MYFSGEESNVMTYDDPENECIRVNPSLYDRVQNNDEQNARVFLDTHLLRIRSYGSLENLGSKRLVSKSDASVSLGTIPFMPALVYITGALMEADFREMTSDEFKESYLAPFDNAIRNQVLAMTSYRRSMCIHVGMRSM